MDSIPIIYLSICIPTNGRIEILKNTLDSIYVNCEVDYSEFEVILSDNSTNDELIRLLDSYKKYPNIVYSKTTSQGFLNSVNALQMGNGLFLKLHNNYTNLNSGSLAKMISFIKANQETKPLVFFTNGCLKSYGSEIFRSFDSFSKKLSYWNSWSTGFSIWKKDFDLCPKNELNHMFPHTSLLLSQYKKNSFVIDDDVLFVNSDVPKKGGYNLFKIFGIDYLLLMNEAKEKKSISLITFNRIKRDLFYNFLVIMYYQTKILKNDFTFELVDIKKSIKFYYSNWKYYLLIFLAYFLSVKIILKNYLLNSLFSQIFIVNGLKKEYKK